MGKSKSILMILLLSIGMTMGTYSQNPPPPNEKRHGGPPCDPGSNGNGNPRPGVPPPVGLCLPIDDYVYILMAVGVMYGCYKVRKFEVD